MTEADLAKKLLAQLRQVSNPTPAKLKVIEASQTKALVTVEEFDRVFESNGVVWNPVLDLREAIRHHPGYITSWWRRYRDDGI